MASAFFLTLSGIISRIIGFFYKIFLSNIIGARNLGVYSLIFTVYGICHTIYAAGIQTALSKLVAEQKVKNGIKGAKEILFAGCIISFSLASALSFFVFFKSRFIAYALLNEPDCDMPLKVLSVVFPFCSITACINGYYYGLKKALVPAVSQLVEQFIRVGTVMFIVRSFHFPDNEFACCLAITGIVAGEIGSQIFNLASLIFNKNEHAKVSCSVSDLSLVIRNAAPLTAGKLSVTILHSAESVIIPLFLKKYGFTSDEALSLLGILNGMVIPFILFPSALTGALSILLLPAVSEAKAGADNDKIKNTSCMSIKFSLITGIFSTGVFIAFGDELGCTVFNEPLCGTYLTILSWLCPFLYVSATFNSILNGLGRLNITLVNSVAAQILKLALIAFLVPSYGMNGYFIAFLVSQVIVTIVDLILVIHYAGISLNMTEYILKPTLVLIPMCSFFQSIYNNIINLTNIKPLFVTGGMLIIFTIMYFGFLIALKIVKPREFA